MEIDSAVYRMDIQTAISNGAYANRPAESFHVEVGMTDVSHFYGRCRSFQDHIATQPLSMKGSVDDRRLTTASDGTSTV